MAEQRSIVSGEGDMGGSMRLGSYPAELKRGSIVAGLYGKTKVSERHRHRYEVNNAYREQLEKAGIVFSGLSPDRNLVEYIELPADVHPFFVATQAHPEFTSRPTKANPLFSGLVEAAIAHYKATHRSASASRKKPAKRTRGAAKRPARKPARTTAAGVDD